MIIWAIFSPRSTLATLTKTPAAIDGKTSRRSYQK
jgi:hypothetical protein